jgi:hypothetical protein
LIVVHLLVVRIREVMSSEDRPVWDLLLLLSSRLVLLMMTIALLARMQVRVEKGYARVCEEACNVHIRCTVQVLGKSPV